MEQLIGIGISGVTVPSTLPVPIIMAELKQDFHLQLLRAKDKMIPKDTRYEWISFTGTLVALHYTEHRLLYME